MLDNILEVTLNNSTLFCLDSLSTTLTEAQEYLISEDIDYAKTINHPQKKEEFIFSRALIRKVLAYKKILINDKLGYINWPDGITASLSHKKNWSIFCFEREANVWGLGIDLELTQKVDSKLGKKICSNDELELLDFELGLSSAFCVKEALFKAHYPRGNIMFYFHDAYIFKSDFLKKIHHIKLLKSTSDKSPKNHICNAHWAKFDSDFTLAIVKELN